MSVYEKSVKLLMKDMVEEFQLKPGEVLQREKIFQWFQQHYPKIKEGTIQGHLVKMSTNVPSRSHHNLNPNSEADLFFRIASGRYRLYDPANDPTPIYTGQSSTPEINDIDSLTDEQDLEMRRTVWGASEFAYERNLQDFLSKNPQKIEPGLKLYEEEGITGIEFPAGGGRAIDILAVDKDNNYVVIELKVSRGYDKVIGQLLRYMAWIEKHHADSGQSVRGVIIAKEITDDLRLATSLIKNVELFEYELSFSLGKVDLS
ncbi:MAG: endonuclease NucS [Candidatus Adiutrix sp.]|nr:endonuclease NucS [Candidatus Adiutrix sp.]